MTIVQLADLDDFLKDSLSIVRRGVANARNANQADPLLGIMADLPEKIDFEVMVVSNYQYLNRITSSTSDDNEISIVSFADSAKQGSSNLSHDFTSDIKNESESSGSRESSSIVSGDKTNETTNRSEKVGSGSLEVSLTNGIKASSSSNNSKETLIETSGGVLNDGENGIGSGNSNLNGTENSSRKETKNSNQKSTETKTEKNNTRQSGATYEQNKHQVKSFDQDAGKWGSSQFAPVLPFIAKLKCS